MSTCPTCLPACSSPGCSPGFDCPRQGPLRDTREAFWQMVVEGGASAVVMLTNLGEAGVSGCGCHHGCA